MFRLKRITFIFLVVALVIIAPVLLAQEAVQSGKTGDSREGTPDSSITTRVDKIFEKWDKSDSPGCVLGVSQNGALVYERGYGMANLELGVAITPASIFRVASITKQFTAMAILILAQRGQLSLDDDVRKYITELPDYGSRLTLRHLLTHTSGLRDGFALVGLAEPPAMLDSPWRGHFEGEGDGWVKLLGRQKALNAVPGTEYAYLNAGYALLGLIVKRVSGQWLGAFTDSNIFRPLGMTHTHFHDDPTMIIPNRTSGYYLDAGGFHVAVDAWRWSTGDAVGNTGLCTTARDLLIWEQNFADVRVGDPALVAAMQTPTVLTGGDTSFYGFGLNLAPYRGLRTIGHGGDDPGYSANVVRFPDQGLAVAVLCNLEDISPGPGELSRSVASIYLADVLPTPAVSNATAAPPDIISIPEKELASLTGLYFDPITEAIRRFYMKDGKLMIEPNFNGPSYVLSPLGQNRFKVLGAPPPVGALPRENVFVRPIADGPMQVQETGSSAAEAAAGKTKTYYAVQSVTLTSVQLAEFTGKYLCDELAGATYTLAARDSGLVVHIRGRAEIVLKSIFADAFQGARVGIVKFSRDANGVVTGFTVNTGGVRGLRFDRVTR